MNGHIFRDHTFAPSVYVKPMVPGIFHGNCRGRLRALSIKHFSMIIVLIAVRDQQPDIEMALCRQHLLEKYPNQAFVQMFCRLEWQVGERGPLRAGAI